MDDKRLDDNHSSLTATPPDTPIDAPNEKDLEFLEIAKAQQAAAAAELRETESSGDPKVKKKKKKEAVSIIKLFRFSTPRDRIMIFFAILGSIFSGAILPVSIIIFGDVLRNLGTVSVQGTGGLMDQVRPLILLMVYLGVAVTVGSYMANSFWIITGENQTRRIRLSYLHAVLRQDMSWFDKAEEGSLNTRLSADTQTIQDGISEKFGIFIMCIAQFISGYIVAFVKGWKMALVILATVPITVGSGVTMGILIRKYTANAQTSYADAGAIAEQVFSGLRTVYSFSLQERFARLFENKLVKARKAGIKRGMVAGLGHATMMGTLFLTYSLAFWFGSGLVKKGETDGASVLVVFMAMMMGSFALLQLSPNMSAVSSACGAAYSIYETIDRVPDIDPDSTEGKVPAHLEGHIEFDAVRFRYPTRPDLIILKKLSLKIKPGMTVAFVGPSGSGKSTSIQLLQRFYDPLEGKVLLDGCDIKDYNIGWLRQQIGVVGQEPVLFNMSIRQNLLMGVVDPHKVSQDDLEEACKKANCHTFISQLPKGYNTLVGEHGGMLSGGQKQRIAIARAILKNPTILLLDEATSALDTQSERLVQRALDAAAADRTTIVIAHRLSTIRNADLIVVMDHGDLVEQGTHAELIALGGLYADLVRKQEISTERDETNPPETQETHALLELERQETKEVVNSAEKSESFEIHIDDGGKVIRRVTTGASIDAFDHKIRMEKALKKANAAQKVPILQIIRDMRPEWPFMALGCMGATVAGAIFPCYALVFSQVIVILTDQSKVDEIQKGPVQGTNLYAFLFLVIGIVSFLSFGAQNVAFEVAGERYTDRLRIKIFRAYMRQEVGYFDREENSMGALTSKLAVDAKNVNELVTKVWGDFIQVIVTAVVGLVIAFSYSWLLTLIIMTVSPFIIFANYSESKARSGFEDKTKRANAQSGEVAGEAIKEIRTIASLNKQEQFEAKYKHATEYSHRLSMRKAIHASFGYAFSRGFSLFTNAIAFYAGVRLIQNGWITFNQMFTALMAIVMTATNVGRSSTFTATYTKAKFAAVSAFDVLDRKPTIDPDLEGIEPAKVNGDISFENISFAYPARPDQNIFSGDFDLYGKANMSIALVGPSGCGKSTTIGMLLRWYDPLSGAVRLDDRNVNTYTLGNLRSHIAWVGQEPVLFDMTIRDNIKFGIEEEDVSQERIEEACKAANIHNFIASLPEGYNTRAGDKGSQLSGGQKQRIAIARAWIRKPKVLLLDEATSALDSESEKLVQAALDKVLSEGGRTTITIAHRLSTIQNADLICVVKDGRVAEQGTHWELLALDGVYSELVHQQSLNVIN
ncbi:P-loop containing nucleoside triphosphate hydrolase protein [Dichotomocladium elegans]|nr:P-loop containing nucleoside triphosphate hydrolase protein [Dichotomocladium elegans]